MIMAFAYVPSADVTNGYGFTYAMQQDKYEGWISNLCRESADGKCTAVDERNDGYTYLGIGYQASKAESELSLW